MAYKPRVVDVKLREQRLQRYQAARSISASFPILQSIALEVRFAGADRHAPYKQIYMEDMQAYFYLQCPSMECEGGGFDLNSAVLDATKQGAAAARGQTCCTGTLSSGPHRGSACRVTLSFHIDCIPRLTSGSRRR